MIDKELLLLDAVFTKSVVEAFKKTEKTLLNLTNALERCNTKIKELEKRITELEKRGR